MLGITPKVKKGRNKSNVEPESQYLDEPRSLFSESIDSIRTSLLFWNIEQPPKAILVTSASSGGGKSTLAITLAAAFSQLGNTLLLEVELRKPSIAKNLAIQEELGLTDLVMGTITSADAGFKTDINGKLSVITCGSVPRNPLELLSSQKFDKVLSSLKNHFDHIILDGPPTLPVRDSCIFAHNVDWVLLLVKADATKVKVAQAPLSRLHKSQVNVIWAVLTIAY